jgi:hypothetical protein
MIDERVGFLLHLRRDPLSHLVHRAVLVEHCRVERPPLVSTVGVRDQHSVRLETRKGGSLLEVRGGERLRGALEHTMHYARPTAPGRWSPRNAQAHRSWTVPDAQRLYPANRAPVDVESVENTDDAVAACDDAAAQVA